MLVLVVDDELAVRESLSRTLRFEGYRVLTASDGEQALRVIAEERPHAMVLDVMMPVVDGLETCRRLRAAGDLLPILLLTARGRVSDRVSGLDAGADDYLPKPFALEELLARLRALLRRSGPVRGTARSLVFADLDLDPGSREVTRAGRRIELTRTEFALLETLLAHPRQVLHRTQLYQAVWGWDPGAGSNSLDVYIGYLRRKLEAGGETRLLHTVRGVGYVLRDSR